MENNLELKNELDALKNAIEKSILSTKSWFTVKELADYLSKSVGFVYKAIGESTIPYYKPNGEKLVFFKREEIDQWIEDSRIMTLEERNKVLKAKY